MVMQAAMQVIVATVIMSSAYISRSIPERISSFAKSIPLVINGNPGMINSMEQIYPASCAEFIENTRSNIFNNAV